MNLQDVVGVLALILLGAGRQAPKGAVGVDAVARRVMIADFNQAGWRNNLGEPFGTWEYDPGDRTQSCRARLVEEPRVGSSGYSLMLEYDVASPNPAFNGWWMKLPSIPLHRFQALSVVIKGDPDRDFTRRLKLELKSKQRTAVYVLDGIQSTWVRTHIPLSAFDGIEKITEATEFVVVFDDHTVTQKVGALYLDEVAFESAP